MGVASLEDYLLEHLKQDLARQARSGSGPRRRLVDLPSEAGLPADFEPWCVLDPSLFEDSTADGYRPLVAVHMDLDTPTFPAGSPADVPGPPEGIAPAQSHGAAYVATDHAGSHAPEEQDTDGQDSEDVRARGTAQLRAGLATMGVDELLLESLTGLARACATVADVGEQPTAVARAQALLGSIETLTATAGHLDAVLVSATTQLTAANGQVLLLDKGATTPEEFTSSQREAWRAQAKRVTRHEIGVAIGWGPGEVSDLVALANTPSSVAAPVTHAMRTGEATWRLARRFQRQCGPLDTEDAAAVAHAMFGADPAASVTERLDSCGEWTGRPWVHQEYYRALDREVRKITGRDPDATKKTRQANLAGNDVRVNVDEHGTACLMIGCTATQGAAIADRIERAARAARAGGDPRTLRELRVAAGAALLLHGTLDMDDLPADPALITVEQSAQLTKILHALPTAELSVIVPLNTLIGTTAAGLTPTTGPVDADGNPIPAAFSASPTHAPTTTGRSACTCQCSCGAFDSPPTTTERTPQDGSRGEDCPDPDPTAQPCPPGASSAGSSPPGAGSGGEVGVAEVIGKRTLFLAADEVRALALTPGTTMFRLLTDPATGTLIERSTTAYRFDAAMRAHIIAADVFCRVPGCLKPASLAQIDHVQEHGTPGGHTCVSNGQPVDPPHHDLKTKKLWDAVMADNRDVTWTTLLGRIYKTKAHDYNQYTRLLTAATTQINQDITGGADPAAVVDAAIYQALSYRPPGASLTAEDDDDYTEVFLAWDQVSLTHTTDTGRRTYHPTPEVTRAEHDRLRDTRDDDHERDGASDAATDTTDDDHEHDGASDGSATDRATPPREPNSDGPSTPWSRDPAPPPF